jgi:hypothetical protein
LARNRNRYGTLQDSVVEAGEDDNWLVRLADLLDQGNPLPWSLRTLDKSLSILHRYHIISVTSDTTLTIDDQVVLADPASADITITLPEVFNGMSLYIKNIDESGTYNLYVDPGSFKIDGQPGTSAPSTTDCVIDVLSSYEFIFFEDTWWII